MSLARRTAGLLLALSISASAQGAWHILETGPVVHLRHGEAIVRLTDGRLILIGGSESEGFTPSRSTEFFDPETLQFEPGPPLVVPRNDPAAVELGDGRVLVAGGSVLSYIVMSDTAEVLDLRAGRSTLTGSMSVPRGEAPFLAHVGLSDAVIFGGSMEGRFGEVTGLVERWKGDTGRWSVEGRLQLPCGANACVQDGGTVVRTQGSHRCCGDPIDAGCHAWVEAWDLEERRSQLLADPQPTLSGNYVLLRMRPGKILSAGVDHEWWMKDQPEAHAGGRRWTIACAPALQAFPSPPGAFVADSVGDDDVIVGSPTGLLVVHPESGRPTECLAGLPFKLSRVVAVRRGVALVLGSVGTTGRALVVESDEALQASSPAPPASRPKP